MGCINVITFIFKLLCIATTFGFIGMWLYTYSLNEDTTTIENRSYFDTSDDKLPVLSMCFEQKFNDDVFFQQKEISVTGSQYLQYLKGTYFDPSLAEIDYQSVTVNISEYILSYNVHYINGSTFHDVTSSESFHSPYYTFSWDSWGKIVKCFGLEIIDHKIKSVTIFLSRDIFPDGIRPADGGLAFLFHYPNQITWSFHTVKRDWIERDKISNYIIGVNLNGLEAHIHRYKKEKNNCEPNWKSYDQIILQQHINILGCKSPFYGEDYNGTICKDRNAVEEAEFKLCNERDATPPCQNIESVSYRTTEETKSTKKTFQGKYVKNWFGIVYRIRNSHFKAIVQKQKVDFQGLIGYIGGYIGLFTGFAIAQAPELIVTIFQWIKKGCMCLVGCENKNK